MSCVELLWGVAFFFGTSAPCLWCPPPLPPLAQIKLNIPSAKNIWDQKLPIIVNPEGGGYLAFTRLIDVGLLGLID